MTQTIEKPYEALLAAATDIMTHLRCRGPVRLLEMLMCHVQKSKHIKQKDTPCPARLLGSKTGCQVRKKKINQQGPHVARYWCVIHDTDPENPTGAGGSRAWCLPIFITNDNSTGKSLVFAELRLNLV
jgi:hypothetical protein